MIRFGRQQSLVECFMYATSGFNEDVRRFYDWILLVPLNVTGDLQAEAGPSRDRCVPLEANHNLRPKRQYLNLDSTQVSSNIKPASSTRDNLMERIDPRI
jgi:hypothetical protein